jgi:hypothetical protein
VQLRQRAPDQRIAHAVSQLERADSVRFRFLFGTPASHDFDEHQIDQTHG